MAHRTAMMLMVVLTLVSGVAAGGPPAIRLRQVPVSPVVDGSPDDGAWHQVTFSPLSFVHYPAPTETPETAAKVAVVESDNTLFVLVMVKKGAATRSDSRLTRRDADGEFDKVRLLLATQGDGRSGYGFWVSRRGVQQDGLWRNDDEFDRSWDGVWRSAVGAHNEWWVTEVAIPLHLLRFGKNVSRFGLQVKVWLSKARQMIAFSPLGAGQKGAVSTAGQLVRSSPFDHRAFFNIRPEGTLSFSSEDLTAARGVVSGTDWGIGGYITANPHPNWTVDAAILPDFGEVEIDRASLNLTNVETRYDEKRPFFLEGAQLYDTPYQLFYSRRLGAVVGTPALEDGQLVVRGPSRPRLLEAVKLTGRGTRGGFVGAMHGISGPSTMWVSHRDRSMPHAQTVVSQTHFGVLRVGHQFDNGSRVGWLSTHVAPTGRVSSAHVGGVDVDHYFYHDQFAVKGQVVGSAAPTDEGNVKQGGAAYLGLEKQGGEHLRGDLHYDVRSADFDINEAGYLDRADLQELLVHGQYRLVERRPLLSEVWSGAKFHFQWNSSGLSLKRAAVAYFSAKWANNWWTHIGGYGDLSSFDDLEIDEGPAVPRKRGGGAWLGFSSDEAKPLGVVWSSSVGTDDDGYYLVLNPQLVVRADRLELALGNRWTRSRGRISFVEAITTQPEDQIFVMGQRNFLESDIFLKSTLCLSERVTLQVTAQALVSAAHYHHFFQIDDQRHFLPVVTDDDYDFAKSDVRVQALLRFEPTAEALFYLSYTLSSPGEINGQDRTFGAAWQTLLQKPIQAVMLKVSRLFTL